MKIWRKERNCLHSAQTPFSTEHAAVQGYITTDVNAYVGGSPPVLTSFMEDSSGQNLVLNVSVAYPGNAPRTSQVSSFNYYIITHLSC